MGFPTTLYLPDGEQYNETSYQQHPLGTRLVLPGGRVFCYTKNGAIALAVGVLVQAAVPVALHRNRACDVARAIGADRISATLGATAAAKDLYAEGYVHVNDATGKGWTYAIKEHAAVLASGVLTAILADGVRVKEALVAATSEVTLTAHPHSGVIVHPSPATSLLVGVSCKALTASYYGWLQTWGWGAVLTDGTVVINEDVVDSASVDGAVAAMALTEGAPNADAGQHRIGEVLNVNATGEYSLVFLKIAP